VRRALERGGQGAAVEVVQFAGDRHTLCKRSSTNGPRPRLFGARIGELNREFRRCKQFANDRPRANVRLLVLGIGILGGRFSG
jgi:hypothetical protein